MTRIVLSFVFLFVTGLATGILIEEIRTRTLPREYCEIGDVLIRNGRYWYCQTANQWRLKP